MAKGPHLLHVLLVLLLLLPAVRLNLGVGLFLGLLETERLLCCTPRAALARTPCGPSATGSRSIFVSYRVLACVRLRALLMVSEASRSASMRVWMPADWGAGMVAVRLVRSAATSGGGGW